MNLNEHQDQAVKELHRDLLVLAGAGTGKTRVLTEKYLYLLEAHRWSPQRIVAITFTQKAAYEMQTRVRESLEAKIASASSQDMLFWQGKLDAMSQAYIGTFHGFCQRLLKEFAFEAGISPMVQVLSAGEERILINRAVERTCARMAKEGTPEEKEAFFDAVLQFGLDFFMRSMGSLLSKLRESGKPIDMWIQLSLKTSSLQTLEDGVIRLREAVMILLQSEARRRLSPRGQGFLDELEADFAGIIPEPTGRISQTTARLERLLGLLPKNLGTTVRPLVDDIHEEAANTLAILSELASHHWLPVVGRFLNILSEEYHTAKGLEGRMDFADLQINARDLLRDNSGICRECQMRYDYFMVDEFQDTNMLQLEIVRLLVGTEERSKDLGRLFVVGDAKQSIYRFRGAQVEVVQSLSDDLNDRNGLILPLQANYRCHPAVIDGVNVIFNQLFADESIVYHPLEVGRQPSNRDKECRWEIIAVPEVSREEEAQRLASHILNVVKEGTRQIEGKEGAKKLRYGDIAILMRVMTDVRTYEMALRQWGIPYRIAGGVGYYGLQEVQDQLHLIRLIHHSQDVISLLGLLRSPYCGWNDEAIYYLAGVEKDLLTRFYDLESVPEAIQVEEWERLIRLRTWIKRFQSSRGIMTVSEILRTALDELGYAEVLCAFPHAERRLANIDKLMRKADDFSKTVGRYGLGDFIEFVGELIAAEEREGEAEVELEDDNMVQILTIHASKGLEFPLVIITDMERRLLKPETSPIVFHHGQGLGFKVPDGRGEMLETPRRAKILEIQRLEELSEMKRVLYVALTRAKDYVILSGIDLQKPWDGQVKSWADWIRTVISFDRQKEELFLGDRQLRLLSEPLHEVPDLISKPPIITFMAEAAATTETVPLYKELEYNPNVTPFIKLPVTGLLKYLHCPRVYYQKYRLKETEQTTPAEGGRQYGPLIGQVVHRLIALESVNDAVAERFVSQSIAIIPLEDRGRVQEAVLNLWRVYWESYYAGLKGRILSEYQFIMPLGSYYLQGIIDRLIIADDGSIVLVDFKTDRITKEGTAAFVQRYRPQLLTYALAVNQLFSRPPTRSELFFLSSGTVTTEEFSQDEIDEWQKKLTEAAASCVLSQNEEDFKPTMDCASCPERQFCSARTIIPILDE